MKQVVTYALCYGLIVAFAKGLLSNLQRGKIDLWEVVTYFLIAALLAIPLFLFKQERQRHGVVMDHIILLCISLVVVGGMFHDQIAVRVSKEYYTVGHFPISGVENDFLLAVIWGFLGTWWLGAGIGIILAMVACAGERPHFPIGQIFKISIFPLLAIELIAWLIAGVAYYLTKQDVIGLEVSGYSELVPKAKHAAFMADWWANGTAYSLIIIGFILLACHIWRRRKQYPAQ